MALSVVQIISLLGAFLILTAFALLNFKKLSNDDLRYQLLNLIGAGFLTYTACVDNQYGFIILEATWCLVSAYGSYHALRRPKKY